MKKLASNFLSLVLKQICGTKENLIDFVTLDRNTFSTNYFIQSKFTQNFNNT